MNATGTHDRYGSCRLGSVLAALVVALGCGGGMTSDQAARLSTTINIVGTIAQVAASNFAPEHAGKVELVMNFLEKSSIQERGVVTLTEASAAGLALEVALMRRAADGSLSPIADGDILVDGRGDPQAGDRFGVLAAVRSAAHLYIISVDATGWIQTLHPTAGNSAATAAGTRLFLPGAQEWYGLDDARGLESFYFIVSEEPLPELEAAVAPFAGLQRPPAKSGSYASVTQPTVVTRGVARTRKADTPAGGAGSVAARTFLADAADTELIVTRWFQHR